MKRSHILALSVLVILGLWMLSGVFSKDEQVSPQTVEKTSKAKPPMRVKVTELVAKDITQEVVIQGRLEPFRQIEVKSLLNTVVETVPAKEGTRVKAGQVLATLAVTNRQEQVEQAAAKINSLQLEVAAAQQLLNSGLNSETRLRSAQADLAAAKTELKAAQLALSYTQVVAAFDGVWEQRHVERGSHVDVGQSIGVLVDNSILKAVAFVSQQAVAKLSLGQQVNIELLDGRAATGELTYIANVGDEQTQSFRIEAEIVNHALAFQAGASAEIRIQTGTELAHFVSPSAFSLGPNGEVGIKSIDADDHVVFYPVKLVRKDIDGVWVTGLPSTLTLITLGQGFVSEGDVVNAVRG